MTKLQIPYFSFKTRGIGCIWTSTWSWPWYLVDTCVSSSPASACTPGNYKYADRMKPSNLLLLKYFIIIILRRVYISFLVPFSISTVCYSRNVYLLVWYHCNESGISRNIGNIQYFHVYIKQLQFQIYIDLNIFCMNDSLVENDRLLAVRWLCWSIVQLVRCRLV